MRILKVVRLQLMNKETFIWAPLLILGIAVVISYLIYLAVPSDGPMYGGGAQAPLWYFSAVAILALTRTFPFSQALSITRREFYLGTLLTAVLTAAALAVIFVIGGLIEQATNGLGTGGRMFYLDWIWVKGPLGAAFVYFSLAMLFFVIGYFFAVIFKGYGQIPMMTLIFGFALVLVGLIALVTWQSAWPDVWRTISNLGAVGLAAWGLLAAVVLAVIGWFPMRRAIA